MKSTIHKKIENTQRAVSGYLNHKVNSLSPFWRKVLLIVIGIMIGLTCLSIVIDSVYPL